jgi:glycosyl hydrolase family 42 (putative beta-galactosidase)
MESSTCYKATNLPSFLASIGGAYGTPMVDELGSYGTDEPTAAAYLGAAAASALANGASGIFAWCWQDIASTADPYRDRPAERMAGLHRLDGSPKPAMTEFASVVENAGSLTAGRGRARTALFLPQRLRGQGGSYLDGGGGSVATFYSFLLLKRAHIDFDVTTDDLADRDLIVCPSLAHVTSADIERITAAVADGATAYVSLGDHLHGHLGEQLTGTRIVDFELAAPGKAGLCWGGSSWDIAWDTAAVPPVTVRVTTGRVLGSYQDGTPAMVGNRVGKGRVLFCAAPFERQLDQPGRLTSTAWHQLYLRLASLAGVTPAVQCDDADIEIVPLGLADVPAALAVNHGPRAVRADLGYQAPAGYRAAHVALAAKEWAIVRFAADGQAGRCG